MNTVATGKTAIVIGATGLVGTQLLLLLKEDDSYSSVKVFSRRAPVVESDKFEVALCDFDKVDSWSDKITGDVLFSCMGTTIKKAGSKAVQYKIDFTYQYEFAKRAAENGIEHYVLISSMGANEKSSFFYGRMKGELEQAVGKLPFKVQSILKPSILDGDRKEFRLGESIGLVLMKALSWVPGIKKYRPILGRIVAAAMVNAATRKESGTYELEEVHEMAKKKQLTHC